MPEFRLLSFRLSATWIRIGVIVVLITIALIATLSPDEHPEPRFPALLSEFGQPIRRSVDAPSWVDSHGENFTLPGPAIWRTPLGKNLAIIDFDTRPLDQDGEITFPGQLDYDKIDFPTAGMLNHYTYAMIHGYDYHFIRIPKLPDRAAPWSKISALAAQLRHYSMVVSIDADAIFTHLDLPFEWLLNRWQVPPGTSLAMATDPAAPENSDKKGRVYNNAGFIIAQDNPRTHEILRAWDHFPDNPQFLDASSFKTSKLAEQAAFGEYIRYIFDRPTDLKELPCNEANGFPESKSGCNGVFVRHMWTAKGNVRDTVARFLSEFVLSRVHLDLKERMNEVVKVHQ